MLDTFKYYTKKMLIDSSVFSLVKKLKNIVFRKPFFRIMLDVTNNCNLRCPFCYNTWENVPFVTMSDALFYKAVTLAPLTWKGEFYISCSYEPTLHKDFGRLIANIPEKYAKRIQLTTNMTTQLSDELLKALAYNGLYQVNVSIDSLIPDIYESLRVNAKYDNFINNIGRYVTYWSSAKRRPRLNLITVVSKANYSEIMELVRKCHDAYKPTTHEIRYAYHSNANRHWLEANNISDDDWNILDAQLSKLPFSLHIEKPSHLSKSSKIITKFQSTFDPILSIDSQGTAIVCGTDARFDLRTIERPFELLQKSARRIGACRPK